MMRWDGAQSSIDGASYLPHALTATTLQALRQAEVSSPRCQSQSLELRGSDADYGQWQNSAFGGALISSVPDSLVDHILTWAWGCLGNCISDIRRPRRPRIACLPGLNWAELPRPPPQA